MNKATTVYIGLDLGDSHSRLCVVDRAGKVVRERTVATSRQAIHDFMAEFMPLRKRAHVVMEVGTHSPWVARLLETFGVEVMVCDPAILRRAGKAGEKSDRADARLLADLLRSNSQLLRRVEHRSEEQQADWSVLVARSVLVETRTKLTNSVRGLAKTLGKRLPKSRSLTQLKAEIPELLQPAVEPVLTVLETIEEKIKAYDKVVEKLGNKKYLAVKRLKEIDGVGPLISLAFVLSVFRPQRFRHARSVGKYFGTTPKLEQSGSCDRQLGITKAGNPMLRRLLVQGAQYLLRTHGPDCDLRRWGLALAARGGKNAKKRAVIGVARRLAVKMLAVWKSGVPYDPLYDARLIESRLRQAS